MIDKSDWGDGPWQSEPDALDWVDEATGFKCQIRRNDRMGILLGYVGVPPGHPAFGWCYDDAPLVRIEVHGGLTYANPGDAGLWWLGFDCGGAFDYPPGMVAYLRSVRDIDADRLYDRNNYRDIDYVKRECAALAQQLAKLPRWQPVSA